MFDNFKGFMSVVQEGLTSGSSLRQTLTEVQKSTFAFNDKQNQRTWAVSLTAGSSLLSHYQRQWAELHAAAEENAVAADKLDRVIEQIHQRATTTFVAASDLYQSLQSLPKLSSAVDECVSTLEDLGALVSSVEADLQQFEDLVERQAAARRKLDHHYHLQLYKERKMAALDEQQAVLSAQSAARQAERERRQLRQLQAAAEASSRAFDEDLRAYKTTGVVPKIEAGSPAAQSLTLEQVELAEDRDDLDAFLDS